MSVWYSALLVLNGTSLNNDSALLVLNGTSLNGDSALLALNWRYSKISIYTQFIDYNYDNEIVPSTTMIFSVSSSAFRVCRSSKNCALSSRSSTSNCLQRENNESNQLWGWILPVCYTEENVICRASTSMKTLKLRKVPRCTNSRTKPYSAGVLLKNGTFCPNASLWHSDLSRKLEICLKL